jgi:hypothetical protein
MDQVIIKRRRGRPSKNKGGNIITDTYEKIKNEIVNPDSNLRKLIIPRFDITKTDLSNYPNSAKKTMEELGNYGVVSAEIVRTPITTALRKLINLVTSNKFDEAAKNAGYDKLFHLQLVLNVVDDKGNQKKVAIQKTERVQVDSYLSGVSDKTEYYDLKIGNRKFTPNMMLEKTRKRMGDTRFFGYDAFKNNCQVFILELLRSEALADGNVKKFVYQDTRKIAEQIPEFNKKIMNFATDAGNVFSKLLGNGNIEGGAKRTDVDSKLRQILNEQQLEARKKLLQRSKNVEKLLKKKGRGEMVTMPKKDYVEEHQKLIDLLEKSCKEGKKQKAELKSQTGGRLRRASCSSSSSSDSENGEKIKRKAIIGGLLMDLMDMQLKKKKVGGSVFTSYKFIPNSEGKYELYYYPTVADLYAGTNRIKTIYFDTKKELKDRIRLINHLTEAEEGRPPSKTWAEMFADVPDAEREQDIRKHLTEFGELTPRNDRGMGRKKGGKLNDCPPGYKTYPLTCQKDLSCNTTCEGSRDWFGNCYAWNLRTRCEGPSTIGRVDIAETNAEIRRGFEKFGSDTKNAFEHVGREVKGAFEKFGANTKEAFESIGNKIKNEFTNDQSILRKAFKPLEDTIGNEEWWKKTMTDPDTYILLITTALDVAALAGVPGAGIASKATKIIGDLAQGRQVSLGDLADMALALVPTPKIPASQGIFNQVKSQLIGTAGMSAVEKAQLIGRNVAKATKELAGDVKVGFGEIHEGGQKYKLHAIVINKKNNKDDAVKYAEDIAKKKNMFVRETKQSYRFRNVPKTKFESKTFRTKKLYKDNKDIGVSLIFGKLK